MLRIVDSTYGRENTVILQMFARFFLSGMLVYADIAAVAMLTDISLSKHTNIESQHSNVGLVCATLLMN